MSIDLERLGRRVGEALRSRGAVLATVESCTGGWVAEVVTAVPGSSAWFDRGYVTYSNQAKIDLVGVSALTLERHGAVSEPVVREMACGALARSPATVAVAISGVAGPGGGTPEKPVGMVCLAWAREVRDCTAERSALRVDSLTVHLPGDRAAVRQAAVIIVLEGVCERLVAGAP